MNKSLLPLAAVLCGLLAGLLCCSASAAESPSPAAAEHVVLISIDGLRPEFYLDPSWAAPMLRQLKARGAFAEGMDGVFPTVTYPSHTTLVSGAKPARHGIFYNTPFEPAGVTGKWYWEYSAIEVPTLFSALRENGRRSASLGWPVTVGAPIDWNLPEIWPLGGGDFMEITRRVASPGLVEELEREATGRLLKENFDIGEMSRDDRFAAAAEYLLTRYKPALLAVHLVGTDHFQHEDGRDSDRVRRAVAAADRAVARIYEAAERAGMLGATTFVIVGDHGHIDRHTVLAPNVALAAAGLHPAAKERGKWRVAFQGAAAAAYLHLADPKDQAAAVEARAALEKLPPGARSLFRIVERDELDRLGAAPEAVFALAPIAGVDISEEAIGELLRPAKGATHGYLPDTPQMETGFIASGAGIRAGAAAYRLRMVDVAPLVARLLGLPFPESEGQVPLGFLTTP
jgi:hypothetical protein